jgi:hypothetical protein
MTDGACTVDSCSKPTRTRKSPYGERCFSEPTQQPLERPGQTARFES